MKKRENKRKRSELRARIMQNNLMQRFIREIEREDTLDDQIRGTMLIPQPLRIR